MKIFHSCPTTATISGGDFTLDFSRFTGGAGTAWDSISPEEADYIIVPYHLKAFLAAPDARPRCLLGGDVLLPFTVDCPAADRQATRARIRTSIVKTFLSAFPFYTKYPEKHIFFDTGDVEQPCPVLSDSILFKTNVNYRDSKVLPIPYPMSTDPLPPYPISKADLDLSFCGLITQHPIRERLSAWSRRQKGLRIEFRSTKQSIYSVDEKRSAQMQRDNFDLMLRSRFVLSPRGIGTSSRRFYEILAHGRIPVLFSDCCRLPLESVIDYHRFVVRVPEGFVRFTEDYIRDFQASHDLLEASALARQTYLEFFSRGSFRHFIESSLATRNS